MFSSYIIYILSKLNTYFDTLIYNSCIIRHHIRDRNIVLFKMYNRNQNMNPGECIKEINYWIKVCWRWNQASTGLSRWMHKSHIWNTFRRIVTTLHWELAARRQGTRSMSGVSPSVPRTAWELDSTVYTSCITYPKGRAKRIRIVFTLGQWAKIYRLTGKLDILL